MKIIDLSMPLIDGMDVYPGDPQVHIKQIHSLEKEGWKLRYLQFSTHIGTHADAFAHMDEKGQTIDEMPIEKFIGKAVMVGVHNKFPKNIGLAFSQGKLPTDLFDKVKAANPRFILVGNSVEWEVDLERKLLQTGILTITNLVNMDQLPIDKKFMFYGVPLKIKDGDGSPVRAFAMVD
jgi:arylformamidase